MRPLSAMGMPLALAQLRMASSSALGVRPGRRRARPPFPAVRNGAGGVDDELLQGFTQGGGVAFGQVDFVVGAVQAVLDGFGGGSAVEVVAQGGGGSGSHAAHSA